MGLYREQHTLWIVPQSPACNKESLFRLRSIRQEALANRPCHELITGREECCVPTGLAGRMTAVMLCYDCHNHDMAVVSGPHQTWDSLPVFQTRGA